MDTINERPPFLTGVDSSFCVQPHSGCGGRPYIGRVPGCAGLVMAAGNVLGGVVGAKLAIKKGNRLIFWFLIVVMVAACGLSFAAAGVHSSAWMFFFMVFVAMGWHGLDAETFNLTIREKFYGETMGVVTAMIGVVFLQWWQRTRG